MKRVFLVVGCMLIGGCQGTPIGDAMIGKEKLAQMDDEYCRSIGAIPGSNPYIQCRLFKSAERDRNHQAAYRRAGAGLSSAGQALRQDGPRTVNCTSTPSSTWVGGPVTQVRTACY